MRKFAPVERTPPAGDCPSAEALATYIDGNLEGAEKERITEHLASCEDCFETYAESVRFLLNSEPAPKEGEVVAFPTKERWLGPWRYRIAALLVLGLGIGWVYAALLAPLPDLMTAELAEPIPNPSAVTGRLWLDPAYRGHREEEVPVDPASFRMGVQLVNLQVALKADDAEKVVGDIIPRILNVLGTQVGGQDLYISYEKLSGDLWDHMQEDVQPREPRIPPALLETSLQLVRNTRDFFEPTPLDLGQWVEAGRLAAIARDPSFFQQGTTRSFLRRLLWRDKLSLGETRLDPPTRESLQEVSRILSEGDLQGADYKNLERQFDKILEIHYPKT